MQSSTDLAQYIELHYGDALEGLLQDTEASAAICTFLWRFNPSVLGGSCSSHGGVGDARKFGASSRGQLLLQLVQQASAGEDAALPNSRTTLVPDSNLKVLLLGDAPVTQLFTKHPLPLPEHHIAGADAESTQLLHSVVRMVMFDTSLPVEEAAGEDEDDDGHHGEGVNTLAEIRQARREEHDAEVTRCLGEKKKGTILNLLHSARLIRSRGGTVAAAGGGGGADVSHYSASPIHSLQFMMATPQVQRWWLLEALLQQEERSVAISSRSAGDGVEAEQQCRGMVEVLCFLAACTDHRTVYSFPSKAVNPLHFHFLVKLSQIGLVYPIQFKDKSRGFIVPRQTLECLIPTSADTNQQPSSSMISATSLNSGGGGLLDTSNGTGIILETNFRLYAYVDHESPVLGILCYFAKIEVCLKKFYVFCITRHSYSRGLAIGLTTDLILRFLEANAHPAMRNVATTATIALSAKKLLTLGKTSSAPILVEEDTNNNNKNPEEGGGKQKNNNTKDEKTIEGIVPDSIVDQFRMWEKEHTRVTISAPNSIMLTCPTREAANALHQAVVGGSAGKDVESARGKRNRTEHNGSTTTTTSTANGVLFFDGQQLVVTKETYDTCIKPLLPLVR